MGNESSRFTGRLARFTRIQKFSGETSTVNHLKSNSFQALVPGGQSGLSAKGQGAEASVTSLLTPEQSHADAVAGAIRDAADEGAHRSHGEEPVPTDMPRGESGGAANSEALDCVGRTGASKTSNVLSTAAASMSMSESSETARRGDAGASGVNSESPSTAISEKPLRTSRHRHVEDGETKHVKRLGSAGSRISGQSHHGGTASWGRANSLGLSRSEKHMCSKDGGAIGAGPAVGTPFPKRPMACKLSAKTWAKLEELFRLMDQDGSNAVTREEARAFFKGAFSNLSADAMFNEVDVDGSGAITSEEFVKFWLQVRASGYKEQDILDEVSELIEGGTWVDWKDGRDTCPTQVAKFPRRPMLCRLSRQTWHKCEELFYRISGSDKEMSITRDRAQGFFKGAFALISADAMFNEIDLKHHGVITARDFMQFWVQVKSSGYKEKDILEEIECLMDGNPWVDWKDGRKT